MFINGVQYGSTYTDNNYYNCGSAILRWGAASYYAQFDEFRFINGYAAYTSNFTPPVAPYSTPIQQNATILNGSKNLLIGNNSTIVGSNNTILSGSNITIFGTGLSAGQSNYTYVNNLSSQGAIAATNITINQTPTTFVNPVTASGSFLIVNVNGTNRAIQLWNYSS